MVKPDTVLSNVIMVVAIRKVECKVHCPFLTELFEHTVPV